MRVLLVDDHKLISSGMRGVVEVLFPDSECHEAASCEQALEIGANHAFDLILLDWNMPGLTGVRALQAMREACPDSPIVIVTGEESDAAVWEAIDAGALGFLPKDMNKTAFFHALGLVLAGSTYIPERVVKRRRPQPDVATAGHQLLDALTAKQIAVLQGVIQGKPNKSIARDLDLSDSTVKAHLSAAYRILDVKSRTEAIHKVNLLGISAELGSRARLVKAGDA